MSRLIYIILVVMLIQFPSSPSLQAQTNVIVGIYQNEPLVFTDSDGEIKGIYIDILNYIGKIEGWQIEYIAGSWNECISRLEKGEIDLLVAIAYSEGRSKRYNFNSETLVTNWAQVYTQQNSQIQSLLDLKGKKIAALNGDIYYQIWVLSFIAGLLALLTGGTLILRWQVRVRTEALRESIAARERIESDLRIAHEIQMDLVPKVFPPFPDRSDFDLYAVLEPAKQVGGDFYDFFFIDPHRLCFLIGDVSDKGVPAALLMARTKTLIKSAAKSRVGPDKILDIVNKEVSINNDLFMFVTVFCGILKTDTGEVWYTNAGHNSPLMVFLRKDPAFIAGTGSTALGIDEDSTFKKTNIMLKSGYTLFMYTDGVTEAFNKDEETFSEERLIQALSSYRQASTRDMVLSILKKIKAFTGDMPQTDDIAILALKYTPSEA